MNPSTQLIDTPTKAKANLGKRLLDFIAFWAVTGIDVIGIVLSVALVLWLLGDEQSVVPWYVSSLVPGILALSPLVAIVGLMKRKRWLLFHLIPAGFFVIMYGMMFIPRSPVIESVTPQLRVMTFNTQFKENTHIAQVILEADADVIALQELVQPMADYLAEELADEYPYQISHIDPDLLTQGKGILSRHPLQNELFETWDVQVNYLRVQIEFADEIVTIVTTHPQPPQWGKRFNSDLRSRHIDWIMDHLTQESGALIVLGDFNTTDLSADYRQITAIYQDSVREVGVGLGQTFPDSTAWRNLQFIPPMIRIDYVFHSNHLTAVSAGAWHESGGSDHRPVVANLILTAAS